MSVTVKTWKVRFEDALSMGMKGLDEAVGLYLWARDHLKELHQLDSAYTQEDTVNRILRVWNVNPIVYVRAACRLGGGESQVCLEAGRDIIRRFGVYEIFRAEQQLGMDQMVALARGLSTKTTPDEFHAAVDAERLKLDAIKPDHDGKKVLKTVRVDMAARIAGLEKENAKLREENKVLRKELAWFKKNVKLTAVGA